MSLIKCVNLASRHKTNFYRTICNNLQSTKYFSTSEKHTEDLLVEKLEGSREGVTVFSLNRPKVKNALSKSLVYSLFERISKLENDPTTRVLILRSNVPKIFCAGADLKERHGMSEEDVKSFVKGLRKMMRNIEDLPIPVIVALDGSAMGGGLEMALAGDLRVAADNVKLGLVETRLAIIPGAGGTQRLPRIIGPSMAKELIFTARVFTGKEAKEMGVVNHCVPQTESNDAAYKKALELAEEMLPNGPVAMKMAKAAIDQGIQCSLSEGYKVEQKCYEGVLCTQDRVEGLKAFNEKRKPRYTGR